MRSFEITDGFTNVKLESTGPGIIVGAGYDIRVGRNSSLTPYGNLIYGAEATPG